MVLDSPSSARSGAGATITTELAGVLKELLPNETIPFPTIKHLTIRAACDVLQGGRSGPEYLFAYRNL